MAGKRPAGVTATSRFVLPAGQRRGCAPSSTGDVVQEVAGFKARNRLLASNGQTRVAVPLLSTQPVAASSTEARGSDIRAAIHDAHRVQQTSALLRVPGPGRFADPGVQHMHQIIMFAVPRTNFTPPGVP